MPFRGTYGGKTVLVTGHTGFKGSWLCQWLISMGAKVVGYALEPPGQPNHFDMIGLGQRLLADIRADVRDRSRLAGVADEFRPDFVFHLAAQTLVRTSYAEPQMTFDTNVMGTVNVLDALRAAAHSAVAIMITTDKVYDNREWVHAYREVDKLGGHDPYSASKAAAEMVIGAYQRSFFSPLAQSSPQSAIAIASVRAGNVIGGGDWALDRIVPDCIRHLREHRKIPVRNKTATRPWQHVLEPLGGYLLLGAELRKALDSAAQGNSARLVQLSGPFNFGPALSSNRPVLELVREVLKYWPGDWEDRSSASAPHEAGLLNLSSDKAFHVLGWYPHWDFERTVAETMNWYSTAFRGEADPSAVAELTIAQIAAYEAGLGVRGGTATAAG
jgi:CDP-glucose 4,6-dehydratase